VYNKIIQFLSANWLIDLNTVQSYLPLFISFINGAKIDAADFKEDHKPYAVSNGLSVSDINIVGRYDLTSPDLPDNSVAIIPIQGIMTIDKTMELATFIKQADSNPSIISKLFLVNTPGGMVSYTDITADIIANSPKPTVSYILVKCCSGGMWLISSSDLIICSSQLDTLGSIGVMSSYMSMTKLLSEKLGIDIVKFYATASTRKNEIERALEDINLTYDEKKALLTPELDFTNDIFHSVIQTNLGIKADSEVFTGATYNAKRAIEIGLAHEINPSVEYALSKAFQLGSQNKLSLLINQKP